MILYFAVIFLFNFSIFLIFLHIFADPLSVWNSNVSFRLNNVAKRKIRLDDGDRSKGTEFCVAGFAQNLRF